MSMNRNTYIPTEIHEGNTEIASVQNLINYNFKGSPFFGERKSCSKTMSQVMPLKYIRLYSLKIYLSHFNQVSSKIWLPVNLFR